MSPYENRLAGEKFRRVGLIALIRPDSTDTLPALAANPPSDLPSIGISNLNLYHRSFGDRTFLFVFLEFAGTDVESVPSLLRDDPWFATLAPHLDAHPRATAAGHPWLRMELMNVIGPTLPAGDQVSKLGLAAGLHPESELWYRTLHQTNWPGVVDQMARSHTRYWVTFMIEFGEQLLLFTYCEYIGTDKAADDAAMAADPVTRRWWKHTEPCLYPLVPGGGNWSEMTAF